MSDSMIAPAVTPLPKVNGWRNKLAYLAHQLRRSPLTMAGLLITIAVLLVMAFAPWLAPHTLTVSIRLLQLNRHGVIAGIEPVSHHLRRNIAYAHHVVALACRCATVRVHQSRHVEIAAIDA